MESTASCAKELAPPRPANLSDLRGAAEGGGACVDEEELVGPVASHAAVPEAARVGREAFRAAGFGALHVAGVAAAGAGGGAKLAQPRTIASRRDS